MLSYFLEHLYERISLHLLVSILTPTPPPPHIDNECSVSLTCLITELSHTHGEDFHCEKATIHQVTTMLATSKNVLFPGHNHLLTTVADDPIFCERQRGR